MDVAVPAFHIDHRYQELTEDDKAGPQGETANIGSYVRKELRLCRPGEKLCNASCAADTYNRQKHRDDQGPENRKGKGFARLIL